jgi:Holliday junction resolvasome RuvABC endonuclease subunit
VVILAIDLAFTVSGWVVLERERLIAWGEIKNTGRRKGEDDEAWDSRRALHIADSIDALCVQYMPDVCAVEIPDWHQRLGHDWQRKYARERQAQHKLGMAKGVAILQIAQIDSVELVYALATEVKKWWGAKRKGVIAGMITSMYPDLERESDHVTDAMSIALYTEAKLTERRIRGMST